MEEIRRGEGNDSVIPAQAGIQFFLETAEGTETGGQKTEDGRRRGPQPLRSGRLGERQGLLRAPCRFARGPSCRPQIKNQKSQIINPRNWLTRSRKEHQEERCGKGVAERKHPFLDSFVLFGRQAALRTFVGLWLCVRTSSGVDSWLPAAGGRLSIRNHVIAGSGATRQPQPSRTMRTMGRRCFTPKVCRGFGTLPPPA
jgi:hypothetical protein